MNTQRKLALGSVLATFYGVGIVLSVWLEWTALYCLWGFLVGLCFGVTAGIAVALAIIELIDDRLVALRRE